MSIFSSQAGILGSLILCSGFQSHLVVTTQHMSLFPLVHQPCSLFLCFPLFMIHYTQNTHTGARAHTQERESEKETISYLLPCPVLS